MSLPHGAAALDLQSFSAAGGNLLLKMVGDVADEPAMVFNKLWHSTRFAHQTVTKYRSKPSLSSKLGTRCPDGPCNTHRTRHKVFTAASLPNSLHVDAMFVPAYVI